MMEDDLQTQEFHDKQLAEIRLGEDAGIDTSIYAKPEYNWLQMEQLRLGLEQNMDVTAYAREDYSHETMKQIRLAWYSQVNLLPFIEKGFLDGSLAEIRIALEEELAIEQWLDPDMYTQQIREIRLGMEQGLDVEIYADISFNWLQMQEIRFGLEAGLDVLSYCDLTYTTREMRKKRLALLQERSSSEMEDAGESCSEQLKKSDISVMVENNGTKAYVFIQSNEGLRITKKELLKVLRQKGIVFGLIQSQIDSIVKKQIFDRNILVAEGQPAVQGKDGWYEFFVKTEGLGKPEILPDGSVDYTAVAALESVEAGQILAVYHSAEQGKSGITVFDKEIVAKRGIEKPTLKGSGFTLEKDKVTYIAKKSGKFDYFDDRIEVTDMIVINEDVTGVTGRIDVDGTVYVKGSVRSGAYIKATGDIVVEDNVEAGEVIAGRSIMVKRGCCSQSKCYLEAGSEVSGKFFEGVTIKAQGNICANYIMNSQIYTMGKVVILGNRGMLFGGKTHAMRGVEAYNIGNNSNLLTVLDVGKNEIYQEKLGELKSQKEKIAEEIHVYQQGRYKLSLREEEQNSEIEEMLKKIEIAIKMKQTELREIEEKIKRLADIVEKGTKTPITVLGTVYAGTLIMIDGSKYLLYHDVKKVSFRRREKTVEMNQV